MGSRMSAARTTLWRRGLRQSAEQRLGGRSGDDEASSARSPQAIPELDGFGEDVISFTHRPLESETHHLAKDSVEIVRHLARQESTILSEEFSARLEIVRHVERATG